MKPSSVLRGSGPAAEPPSDAEGSQIIATSKRLRAAQAGLASVSIFHILDWIDQAAARWLDATSFPRKEAEARLPGACGLSRPMLGFILDNLFAQLRAPCLLRLIQEEMGDPEHLDGFRPRACGRGLSRAFGPNLTLHILPGNISGTAVTSLVLGLLAKSANLLKLSRGAGLLPRLFVETLREIRPDLAEALALSTWSSESPKLTEAALAQADLAVVYGGDETISALRRLSPPTTRLLTYGHKLSLGVVARESIDEGLAVLAAQDVALYDQRGCLSPQLYYLESGGQVSPLEFSKWLGESLDTLSLRWPKGKTPPYEAAQIQQLRAAVALKGGRAFCSQNGLDWTVLYDPDPAFSPSPLSRTVWIKAVDDLSEVASLLLPLRRSLQSIGLACPERRQSALVSALARAGGCRICPIGKMQLPPLLWHHDGQPRLLPLLRFVDLESA